jgi:pimeloyl-ACP methyl ester carboxylesterase
MNQKSFDVNKKPSMFNLFREGRSLVEMGVTGLMMPTLLQAPKGDGHPVMVLPGFLASDVSTRPLRSFLRVKGYQSEGWGLGRNLGTHIVGGDHIVSDELIDQVIRLSVKSNQKVSLVGWSLGGILAREVSRVAPDCVRQVITLGSPFNSSEGTTPMVAKMFEMINGDLVAKNSHLVEKTYTAPPVPSSAIYSRSDGIVSWRACINKPDALNKQTENIEVKGSHSGLGHNHQAIRIIANRLAQPEGEWQPYENQNKKKASFSTSQQTEGV